MQTTTTDLVDLSRGALLAQAREILVRQASAIYAPECLHLLEEIFWCNTAIMAEEQLIHIVRRGDL